MITRIQFSFILIILILTSISCRQKPSPQPNQSQPSKSFDEQMIEANRALIKKDRQKIAGFVTRNGWNMTETDLGLWYEILEIGQGDSAREGMVANFNFTLSLLDGTVCYSSSTDGVKSFLIGKGNVEPGLEKGILYLKEGSKARFIMPPYLAHGLPGDGNKIPARATIIYEIELLSLERKE